MLKKFSFLFSMPLTGILLVLLGLAMAIATFVESAYGINVSWALVYETWWFELLFVLALMNIIGSMFKYHMFRKEKIAVLMFHIAFALIIIGGGITRYFSEEGTMRIREGEMSASMLSKHAYMDVELEMGEEVQAVSEKVRLSEFTPGRFKYRTKMGGKTVKIKSKEYLSNAVQRIVPQEGGEPYLQMILIAGRQYSIGLRNNEIAKYPEFSISFNHMSEQADFAVYMSDSGLVAVATGPVMVMAMGEGSPVAYEAGELMPVEQGKFYQMKNQRFALQQYMPSAAIRFEEGDASQHRQGMSVSRLEIEVDGMKGELFVEGMGNVEGEPALLRMGDLTIRCTYGAHLLGIPFVLRLNDFIIDRYPGSNSPSSFESKVVLIDVKNDIHEDRRIYMNNVLKHQGYRFYQSSYDQDEKGTVLSVKRDLLGTGITYLGYFLMTLGMLLALFIPGSRFSQMAKATARKSGKAAVVLLLLFAGGFAQAQNYPVPSEEQAEAFGSLWVQDKGGRFKPMNTLSYEVMHKISRKEIYKERGADQVMLGMIVYPDMWKNVAMFEVENAELHRMLGYKGEYVSFNDFIVEGRYILNDIVNAAYKKRVQERTDLDKEVMKLDEKVNVFYMVQTGGLLKIFPDSEDPNHSWLAVSDLLEDGMAVSDTLAQVFLLYTRALAEGNDALATQLIEGIKVYQTNNSAIELSEGKKKAEIRYNKFGLFTKLARFYMIFGLTLLVLQFFRVFKPAKWVERMFVVGIVHLTVAFALHTIGLGLRWYISGHAPMSNGYESMIFVSWIALLAGLLFARRTGFAIALTGILAALALIVAHMSWMNPDITNLVPVLKSPWLTIHVTVIMAGYAFLGLSMLMGITNQIFYVISNKQNAKKMQDVISQLTQVNHLTLIIGLYFLTVGMFLGGVWANESWGRYWGWDPKETWALISTIVYAFIAHMHRIPGMRGKYAFNTATVFGFFSILMTYFGVNYFLGGIHSYAGGAAFTLPWWLYVSVLGLVVLAVLAKRKSKL